MTHKTTVVLAWVGGVLLAIGTLYAALLAMSAATLNREYAALQNEGRPMAAEAIIPPRVSDTENAAPLYRAAATRLKAEKSGDTDLFEVMGDLARDCIEGTSSPEKKAEFRQRLQDKVVAEALIEVENASLRPRCRFDLDYSKGAAILMPHCSELRNLSRIICGRARLQADDGDMAGAWRSVLLSLRLANALETEPILISQLVRMAQLKFGTDALRYVCRTAPPAGDQLPAIESALKPFDDNRPFVLSMDGERLLLGEWAFNTLSMHQMRKAMALTDGGLSPLFLLTMFFRPAFVRDHAEYLHVVRSYAQIGARPYSPSDGNIGESLLKEVPKYCVLTRMLLPALSASKVRFIGMMAQTRATLAGLAVLRYRQTHGAYPKSLDECGQGGVMDPFTSKPLIYRVTDDGFVLYSTGEDQHDDGGALPQTPKDKGKDIGWRYVAAPPAQPASPTGK